jgi:probable lipoprotein NlpC
MKKSGFVSSLGLLVLFVSPSLFAAPPLNITIIREAGGSDADQALRGARLALVGEAEKYQGAPYRYGGADAEGFDCSGLIYRSFYDAFSVFVPRNTTALYNWVERIEAEALQPGDLVFFFTLPSDKRRISHAGIYAGEGRFIHAASEGPVTGVIYSRLDENYWRRTFAAGGRVLPAAPLAFLPEGSQEIRRPDTDRAENRGRKGSWREKILLSFGFAPTWNVGLFEGNIIRGGASQAGVAWKGEILGWPFMPGLELRPEWDNTLEVFRMPLTLSLGLNEYFRIFAGPAFSFGDAELRTKGGDRRYTEGTAIIGVAGITVAPFSIKIEQGRLSIYGEAAWQSYFPEDRTVRNPKADFGAAFRLSTGFRYVWGL